MFDVIHCLEDDILTLRKIDEDADTFKKIKNANEISQDVSRWLYADDTINEKGIIILGVFLKSENTCAGVALLYNHDPNWNKVSVGLVIGSEFNHKGIEEKSLALLNKYLFDKTDIKRITAHVNVENAGLQMAFEKAGFRLRQVNAEKDWGFENPVRVNKYVLEKLGNIKYAKIGNGPNTMVILPGLAFKSTLGSADLVEKSYGGIFKDYTIYIFDDRSNIDDNYSIRERAGDVAAEMKTLHLRDACIFGTSMGGMVSQYLAIDHPDLVKKMVITATTSFACDEAREVIGQWKKLALEGKTEELIHKTVLDIYSPTTVEKYGELIEKAIGFVNEKELQDFITLINAIEKFNCYDELDKIRCPVLVTGAYGDRVLFPQSQELIARKLKCDIFMYGSEYGHAVYDEASDHKQRILEFYNK